jgi:hypothetical protein
MPSCSLVLGCGQFSKWLSLSCDVHRYDTLLVYDLGGGTFDVSLLEGWEGILEVGGGVEEGAREGGRECSNGMVWWRRWVSKLQHDSLQHLH